MNNDAIRRVLLVEPDHGVRKWVVPLLEKRSYRVETCEGGEDALSRIQSARFDLVLADERLSDGHTARHVIAELVRRSPFSYSAVITDQSEEEVHEAMESLGILGHFGRRPDPRALEALLERFETMLHAVPGIQP